MNIFDDCDKPLLFWLDCEMTGLDVSRDALIEVGLKITDPHVQLCIDGPHHVIHVPGEKLEAMDAWCKDTHTKNGLIQESMQSVLSLYDVENIFIDFIEKIHHKEPRHLAGSSIWCDRKFLDTYMPRLSAFQVQFF